MRLKFYEVDSEYINYLKMNGDNKIPNIEYDKHKKFFCGIVLTINNFNYFAPVSSYNKKAHTVFLIILFNPSMAAAFKRLRKTATKTYLSAK